MLITCTSVAVAEINCHVQCQLDIKNIQNFWFLMAQFMRTIYRKFIRAVLSPVNRAKPCKFRYVKSVRNFMWKLCYRKDDRAMRPIRGYPENFRDSLTTPTATIPKIFHGLLFRSTLLMFVQNLKSIALPFPEIIGGIQKIGQPLDTPTLPFLQNFYGLLFGMAMRIYPLSAKFEVHSFTCSLDKRA